MQRKALLGINTSCRLHMYFNNNDGLYFLIKHPFTFKIHTFSIQISLQVQR